MNRRDTYTRDTYPEYKDVMMHLSRCLRRGQINDVKEWLTIAERLLRAHRHHDDLRIADDKQEAWRKEQPYRQRLLESRARWAR